MGDGRWAMGDGRWATAKRPREAFASRGCFCCEPPNLRTPEPPSINRLQIRHDLLSLRLEERRQHHLLAERCLILVHPEARSVGGDLEQDPIRLAEVEAAEPVPVHLAAVRDAKRV